MDTSVPLHAQALIAAHIRASARRGRGSRSGPFTVGLDAHSTDPMRNYAVPDHDACPTPGDIGALIAFFRDRQRIPRLEYVEDDAPRAWPALAAAGFTLECRIPVMIAAAGTLLTPRSPARTTIRSATSDTDLAAAAAVQHHAYQMPYPPQPHDIARLTRLIQRGGIVAIAVDETSGTVVGTGLVDVAGDRPAVDALHVSDVPTVSHVPAVDDRPAVGELAAVGVLTAFRRRGIASALSAYLARTAHAQGISLVFLEAEPGEEQLYRRTGFTDATTKIWTSLR